VLNAAASKAIASRIGNSKAIHLLAIDTTQRPLNIKANCKKCVKYAKIYSVLNFTKKNQGA
jgi:hypothetical protein